MTDETPRVAPSRRGRPRVEAPMTSISIRVPISEHDRYLQIANRADKKLSALIRDVLVLRLR